MNDPIESHNILGEMLECLPEIREPIAKKIRSAIALEWDPADVTNVRTDAYGRLWDLFNEVLLPVLGEEADQDREDVLRRSFAFLERVATSPEPAIREFLQGLVGDYLIGRDGPRSYAYAGPEVRATMIRACANWGMDVPADWREADSSE
ncbi:hypothetical protein [Streptomyces sp.]|uniref:hypothetical protein n=1 Tax=Streptomyces sp. TaxID=1931 RepID=UPI002D76BD47|nr:hypothetical protein [Streptomyces sp.]HET6354598.1 hypothetical protein [Streptomyces sp.]